MAAKKMKSGRLRAGTEIDLMLKGRDLLLSGKMPKRRRSSKRKPTKPVTLAVLAKMVDPDLASARVKESQPVLQLTVPTKPQKEGLWFTVAAHDAGEHVYLRLPAAVSVPKKCLNEALKLLRRLHELS